MSVSMALAAADNAYRSETDCADNTEDAGRSRSYGRLSPMTPRSPCTDLVVRFGGITALDGVSFSVARGEIWDSSGRTAPARPRCSTASAGYPPTRAGSGSRARTCWPLPRAPIARARHRPDVPEPRRCSRAVGPGQRAGRRAPPRRAGFLTAALRLPWRPPRGARGCAARPTRCSTGWGWPASPTHPAAGLPFGTLKRVELARALAADPELLLLDEPASGLTPRRSTSSAELIAARPRRADLTVLLVEHHMGMVMGICDTRRLLDFGRKIADGPPGRGAARTRRVIEAYLGTRGVTRCWGRAACTAGIRARQVLHGVDLTVGEGEIVAMLGPNGAGKTTMLRASAGMVRTRGRVRFDGRDLTGARRTRWPGAGSRTCPRGGARSAGSPSRRTCGWARTRRRDGRRGGRPRALLRATSRGSAERRDAGGGQPSAAASSRCWPSPGR